MKIYPVKVVKYKNNHLIRIANVKIKLLKCIVLNRIKVVCLDKHRLNVINITKDLKNKNVLSTYQKNLKIYKMENHIIIFLLLKLMIAKKSKLKMNLLILLRINILMEHV